MSREEQETSKEALGLVREFFAAKERHDLDATTFNCVSTPRPFPCLLHSHARPETQDATAARPGSGQAFGRHSSNRFCHHPSW